MNSNSQDRLKQVHPQLAVLVVRLISQMQVEGHLLEIVQGLRTYAEQDMLYAQGRTRKGPIVTNAKGGQSYHNFGLAVDLCPFVNGQPAWELDGVFDKMGEEAATIGLEWGGSWPHFKDTPHVQLAKLPPLSICRSLYTQGGLDKVWQSVVA